MPSFTVSPGWYETFWYSERPITNAGRSRTVWLVLVQQSCSWLAAK